MEHQITQVAVTNTSCPPTPCSSVLICYPACPTFSANAVGLRELQLLGLLWKGSTSKGVGTKVWEGHKASVQYIKLARISYLL